jgi:hypothetical protein
MGRKPLAAVLLTGSLVVVVAAGGGASAVGKGRNPVVSPATGNAKTVFVVRYRVPRGLHRGQATREQDGDEQYVAHVLSRRGKHCGGYTDEYPARQIARRRGQVVTFRVKPPDFGWCGGRTRVQIRRNYTWVDTEEDCSSTYLPDAGSTQCEDRYVDRFGHDRVAGFRVRVAR